MKKSRDHEITQSLGLSELNTDGVEGQRIKWILSEISEFVGHVFAAIAQHAPAEQLRDGTAIEVGVGALQLLGSKVSFNRVHFVSSEGHPSAMVYHL
jgi:hypothetical protein